MVHYKKCPLCDSENIGLYIQTEDYFLSTEPFPLFKCQACGFVFTQDHPDEDRIGRYYASDEYLSHNDSAKGFSSFLYRLSRSLMLKKKRGIIRKFTGLKSGNLLDIGSGTGHFISEMKKSGWNIKGIEIDEKARQYSVSSLGAEAIPPEQISSLQTGSFDCVTMWHVLEHFQDLFGYASEIIQLLKPGGTCITALPNCSSFDAVYYGKFWAAYDVPRHLWHFSLSCFKLFAGKTGLKIKAVRSLPLDVFYISMLSEKYKGSKMNFLIGIFRGLWFSILSSFKKNKSSSLVFILQKD
jgi:SAM-dependent methyltransferase